MPLDVVSDDLVLVLHVGRHLTFSVAVLVHVGLAVSRRTAGRML